MEKQQEDMYYDVQAKVRACGCLQASSGLQYFSAYKGKIVVTPACSGKSWSVRRLRNYFDDNIMVIDGDEIFHFPEGLWYKDADLALVVYKRAFRMYNMLAKCGFVVLTGLFDVRLMDYLVGLRCVWFLVPPEELIKSNAHGDVSDRHWTQPSGNVAVENYREFKGLMRNFCPRDHDNNGLGNPGPFVQQAMSDPNRCRTIIFEFTVTDFLEHMCGFKHTARTTIGFCVSCRVLMREALDRTPPCL